MSSSFVAPAPSLLLVALFIATSCCRNSDAFIPLLPRSALGTCAGNSVVATGRRHLESVRLLRSEEREGSEGAGGEEEEDWRDFRARLVLGERRGISGRAGADASRGVDWAYETGSPIERGSVVLSQPTPNFGGGLLRHPFWHKAAMLVLEHDDGGTLGVFLNRPSDRTLKDENGGKWRVWYGGPVHSGTQFADGRAELVCLHAIESEAVDRVSRRIMKNIQYCTFDKAKLLVRRGVASPGDFWVFAGYCGWREGQLSGELEAGDWILAAAGSRTVLRELARQSAEADPRRAGLDTWNELMSSIGKDGRDFADEFHDSLLKAWASVRVLLPRGEEDDRGISFPGDAPVRAGMLFRASSRPGAPFLLSEQDMHKSVFLVVSENSAGTVGAFLNLPSARTIDVEVDSGDGSKENATVSFLRRYGGSYVVFGEGGRDSLLLHCNDALRGEGVGTPLDPENADFGIWECTPGDVLSAVRSGKGSPEDFVVVSGGYIWTKNVRGEAGGIRGQVWDGNFEPVSQDRVQGTWDILLEQEAMTEENVNRNIDVGWKAWNFASDGCRDDDVSVFDSDLSKANLADMAMRRWVAKYILDKPD